MDLDSMIPEGMKGASAEGAQLPWSIFQTDIFDAVAQSSANLCIEAVAGSGKSTTIIECTRRLPPGSESLFLAFNKAIVTSLQGKLPYSTTCKTLNALGHGLLMRKIPRGVKLNSYRLHDTARNVLTDEQYEEYGSAIVRLVSLARHNAIGIDSPLDPSIFHEWLGDVEVEIPSDKEYLAARQACEILQRLINSVDKEFDFDDQLYMPIFWDMTFPQYDTVFIDEAQDLSYIQHLQLQKLAQRGARIIAVGDSRQAIYGFRGADTRSMSTMAGQFQMQQFPLSISYRCPKAVVKEAQKIVYHIQAADTAPEGEVIFLEERPDIKAYASNGMILCRTNGPLFSLALEFLQERHPCRLMSNFGRDIIKFVKSFEAKSTHDLATLLETWRKVEKDKAEARGWWGKAQLIQDKYNALIPFCDAFEFKIQVVAALTQLLESKSGTTLSTIHKAKGLEAPTVYILRPDLLPAPFAKTESQIEQEMNLKYVAVTRAQASLIFLPEEPQ